MSIFDKFTRQYSLSKTLRFELKPVGKTLENMRNHLGFDEKLQTFFADQEIKHAYMTLKPIFDSIHEKFITESLASSVAKKINFLEYFKKYKNRKELGEKEFQNIEKQLRTKFNDAYIEAAESLRKKAGKDEKGKYVLRDASYKVLTEQGILKYIAKNTVEFGNIESREKIDHALKAFEGFFTYFGGFNQNRENYYETGKEASTAVATRVVHENLPKFCDNVLFFEAHTDGYKQIHGYLKKKGRNLVNKKGVTLFPIAKDVFEISYFSKCLSQNEIETYNDAIGNANFLINLYNQALSEGKKSLPLPFFKTLFKQIGCGKRDALFFTITHDTKADANKARVKKAEAFSVEEVLELAAGAGEKYFSGTSDDGMINTVPEFLENVRHRTDYRGIYWKRAAVNTVAGKYFAGWVDIKEHLLKEKVFHKNSGSGEIVVPEVVELNGLFKALSKVENWKNILFKPSIIKEKDQGKIIERSQYVSQAVLGLVERDIELRKSEFLAGSFAVLSSKRYKKPNEIEKIKSWMDGGLAVIQMLKYFDVRENKAKGDPIDSMLSEGLNNLVRAKDAPWFMWYDGLRNYLTRKPQEGTKDNKLKLNFENSTLGDGWDVNKEPDNYCVLLQDSNKHYFLAVITRQKDIKGYNKIFVKDEQNELFSTRGSNEWKKIEYKLLPGPNKMLPKCLLPGNNRTKYGATETVLDIYDKGGFKKNESSFSPSSLGKIIDFYKEALKKYEDWRCFNFSFKETASYKDISQFYLDVERQGYKLDMIDINKSVLDHWVDEGMIYLFAINNQDYNRGKRVGHKNNLQTTYWNAIFKILENRPKLNGGAEIFYRRALASDQLEKVSDKDSNLKHFRFSKEKFMFHVPITLNPTLKNPRMNNLINDTLKKQKDVNFLGIDRGEKHLAYYSLIDRNGNIKEQGTLNMPFLDKQGKQRIIKADKRTIGEDEKEQIKIVDCKDYNDLLDARAGDRDYARLNWQAIRTIKELKDGYISQVVRKICDLAIQHNALIILEDLNTGFKRGRQKIEKSVYQKLELALAKKLNFLVDKNAKIGELGSVTNALQLTPLISNFGDIENRKQVGIMLYVRANYTSQTDPITGWRRSIYLKNGSEKSIKEQILKYFTDFGFKDDDYYFTYKDENKNWTLFSGTKGKGLDRFRRRMGLKKDTWTIEKQDIVKILDEVFIGFDKERSFYSQIKAGKELHGWGNLRFAIEMIQQIRNTGTTDADDDFIVSPVRDATGNHFDSRRAKKNQPDSGDANGAYNIARKGIMMLDRIASDENPYIRDSEWDAWLSKNSR